MAVIVKQRNKTKDDSKQTQYSDKQKYQAVALYKTTGNMHAVSRTLGIPTNTLFVWRKSKWWPQFEDDLLLEKRAIKGSTLEKLLQKAAEVTEERLINGDWVFVNGELQRKPVAAKDANRILQDTLKSQVQLEDHYDKQIKTENEIQIQERLKLVMEQMADFAKSTNLRKIGGDPESKGVIDAEIVEEQDAVHDQADARETGADEGDQSEGLSEEGR